MAPRSTVVTCLAVAMVIFSSCNLFGTRDPESPSQLSSNFVPPTSVALVFDNLAGAFRDLSDVNYLKCLADSSNAQTEFRFFPTSTASGVYGVFSLWNKQYEQQYFLNMRSTLQPNSLPSLTLSTPTNQNIFPDSQQVELTYQLNVPHTRTDLPKTLHGKMQVVVVLDRRSGFWYIRRWTDIALNQTDATWSDAKGVFGQ